MLSERIGEENLQKRYAAALTDANEALRIAPLEADLYFQRGISRVAEAFSHWGAAWDFATARFLEPHWAALCFEEGRAWIDAERPDLALDAWTEALRRAGDKGPALYGRMLDWAGYRLGMRAGLSKLSRSNPDYFLVYLNHADRLESDLLISQLVEKEPKLESFSSAQRKTLFSIWFRQGDHETLLSKLLENPDWQNEGWRTLAMLYAEAKNYRRACELARDSTPRPTMPKIIIKKTEADLERAFRIRPDDIDTGLQLYTVQVSLGKTREALETLQTLQSIPKHPAYLDFIETELHEEYEEWELSWKAWLRFGGRDFQ
jgi:tetratricopeptide (TPR) repeat protein